MKLTSISHSNECSRVLMFQQSTPVLRSQDTIQTEIKLTWLFSDQLSPGDAVTKR